MNGKGYHFGRDPVTVGSDVGNLHEGYDDGLVVLGSIASPVLLSLSLSHTFIYTRHITRILTEFTGFYRVFMRLSFSTNKSSSSSLVDSIFFHRLLRPHAILAVRVLRPAVGPGPRPIND